MIFLGVILCLLFASQLIGAAILRYSLFQNACSSAYQFLNVQINFDIDYQQHYDRMLLGSVVDDTREKRKSILFLKSLDFIQVITISLLLIILVLSLLIFPILKEDTAYAIQTYQYSWYFSCMFVSGPLPAILLLLIWLIVSSCLASSIIYRFYLDNIYLTAATSTQSLSSVFASIAISDNSRKRIGLKEKIIYGSLIMTPMAIIVLANLS